MKNECNPMKTDNRSESLKKKLVANRRPFGVTFLILVVLIFTSLNVLRMVTAIRKWDFLQDTIPGIPVLYLVITGAIWSGIGIPLLYGLWTRRQWSRTMAIIAVITYSGYYWSDRLMLADRSTITSRWHFALGFTLLILALSFWMFTHSKSKSYFL
jgi:hypothetical protein